MHVPLHHKYRPQTFSQLVGQGAIAATLTHALEQNRIAPAYLFCGPRGTGKTSSARILAKSLNCLAAAAPTPEPCGQCDLCQAVASGSALDIVEIDAASNTGVDNIRELIERAQFAPVQCRYKLYVLDEVHMLSTAAFNALLKTLEEPPERVVFVLATTDPQRVLPTIISRCQRFDFRRIPLPAMVKHLGHIAAREQIPIADSALQLVAQISQGGLRDAESLLDQLSLQTDEITVETVWELVGAVPERDLLNLVRAIAADDGTALLERVRRLMDKGREPLIVLQSLVGFYRDLLIAQRAPARADLVAITPPTWAEMTDFSKSLSAAQLLASQQKLQMAEVQVKNTTQPRLWLEVALTGLLPSALGAAATLASSHSAAERRAIAPLPQPTATEPPPVERGSAEERITAKESSGDKSPTDIRPTEKSPTEKRSTDIRPAEENSAEHAPAKKASTEKRPAEEKLAGEKPAEEKLAAPPPAAESAPPEVAFGSMGDLWNKILAALHPRGTQMLMSQQGMLLSFDGVSAKVGFRSASLQKMAQQRVPNLEAAFEAVFQRPVKVSLEVVSAGGGGESETVAAAPPAPSLRQSPPLPATPAPAFEGTSPSPNAEQARQVDAPPSNASSTQGPSQGPSQGDRADAAPSSLPPPPQAPPARSDTANPRTDRWENSQDLDNIKRFAQFFNGQIVNLDELENSPGDRPPSAPESPQKKSSDPGPDVPF